MIIGGHSHTILEKPADVNGVLIILEQDAGEIKAGTLVWLSTSDAAPVVLPVMDASNLR